MYVCYERIDQAQFLEAKNWHCCQLSKKTTMSKRNNAKLLLYCQHHQDCLLGMEECFHQAELAKIKKKSSRLDNRSIQTFVDVIVIFDLIEKSEQFEYPVFSELEYTYTTDVCQFQNPAKTEIMHGHDPFKNLQKKYPFESKTMAHGQMRAHLQS